MIPLRDNIPSNKIPYITYSIIGLNIFVFIIELIVNNNPDLKNLFYQFGIVPIRYSDPKLSAHYTVIEQIIPFFTSMFLHGGWIHIIGNMLTLYIFGDNVEDFLGHFKYLLFYLSCGLLAGIFHVITNLHSNIPTIGASGAIAGIMGAYILLYPHARVLVIIPIFFFVELFEVPAYFFLGFWFTIQFFSGALSLGSHIGPNNIYGSIAWWTHIGGFLCGLFIIAIIKKYRYYSIKS